MGNVYDVTKGSSTYKPGGSYWFFAGKDASRAYTTGCFKTHLTHDLRGLSDDQLEVSLREKGGGRRSRGSLLNTFASPPLHLLQQVRGWDTFFANNPKYFVSTSC